jgi:Domain of unknown function (DUF4440)
LIAHPAVSTSPDTQVRDAEAALVAANASHDDSALAELLAGNFLQIDTDGRLHDRQSVVLPMPIEDGVLVHVHGDVAIVIGRAGTARVLRVWVRDGQRWHLASEQDVAIRPGVTDPTPSQELLANMHQASTLDSAPSSGVADVLRAQDVLDRANAMSDPETFARLTDADFAVVTNHGLVRTKSDRVIELRMARLEARPERPVPRRDDVRVRLFGRTAIVTARNWPRTFDGAPRAPSRYTRVWINTSAGWRQLANISTQALQPSN